MSLNVHLGEIIESRDPIIRVPSITPALPFVLRRHPARHAHLTCSALKWRWSGCKTVRRSLTCPTAVTTTAHRRTVDILRPLRNKHTTTHTQDNQGFFVIPPSSLVYISRFQDFKISRFQDFNSSVLLGVQRRCVDGIYIGCLDIAL